MSMNASEEDDEFGVFILTLSLLPDIAVAVILLVIILIVLLIK